MAWRRNAVRWTLIPGRLVVAGVEHLEKCPMNFDSE